MDIAIIGAGATGLTAGYELAGKGHSITVFESDKSFGGLAGTVNIKDTKIENFYHHIFAHDTEIIDLINELGLSDSLIWINPYNGIYINDRLYPFTSPVDLLKFKELSIIDRIRMGLLVYRAKLVRNWRKLENMNSREWIIKNAGKNVYDKVWGPLLNSKFDKDADSVSAVWIWNKFKLRGSTRGKNLSKELLGYLEGSFGRIYKELEERLRKMNGSIIYNAVIDEIKKQDNDKLRITSGDKIYDFDSVIMTMAPEAVMKIKTDFTKAYIEKLRRIRYKANICMMLELKERLSPYYWITIAEKAFPFVLLIEHTNIISEKEYGSHIVYLSRYLDKNDELYHADDKTVKTEFFRYLKQIFDKWDESMVKSVRINRAEFSQPVVVKKYSDILPEFKTPVENLYLANMSQIYPEDRGQNYAIKIGREIARIVCDSDKNY